MTERSVIDAKGRSAANCDVATAAGAQQHKTCIRKVVLLTLLYETSLLGWEPIEVYKKEPLVEQKR